MANNLTKSSKKEIASLKKTELDELIKPLSNEIYLFDSFIAGTINLKDKSILINLKIGDKLTLIRKESKYDENTINILTNDNVNIGYIPEKDNIVFARLMDAGKCLIAKVSSIETKGSFISIGIGIYLVDY